ncbi:hypothetical protein [Pseudodonghicola flavimaris]|uniref:Uncharacterized protein n=1 Tax=Pseudodonghicola flavimaris TaxID=3050036 RepID=A0ABT7EW19_9RHOB|nr:hypothetical protein [Pseudodonghicola flavimaris]MDK3016543.1 hypothetical protein [Pseudodonghicola flavimaris]
MKIRITGAGIFGAKGAIPIGTEMTIKGEPPAGWAGKYSVIEDGAATGAEGVTNPDRTKKRQALEAQAAELQVSFSDETSDDALIEAIKAAKAPKA